MVEAAYIFPKQTALFKHSKKNRSSSINTGGGFLFECGNRKPFPPPHVVPPIHTQRKSFDGREK